MHGFISSGLSSERIILSPFTKEFRGEGHSYESLNFSGATNVARYLIRLPANFSANMSRSFQDILDHFQYVEES